MSLLGIHPTFPSFHFYFIPVSQLALDRDLRSFMQNKKSVPLASGELFTVTVGANTIALLPVYQLVLLVAGKDIGKDDQHQEYQPQIKPDLFK